MTLSRTAGRPAPAVSEPRHRNQIKTVWATGDTRSVPKDHPYGARSAVRGDSESFLLAWLPRWCDSNVQEHVGRDHLLRAQPSPGSQVQKSRSIAPINGSPVVTAWPKADIHEGQNRLAATVSMNPDILPRPVTVNPSALARSYRWPLSQRRCEGLAKPPPSPATMVNSTTSHLPISRRHRIPPDAKNPCPELRAPGASVPQLDDRRKSIMPGNVQCRPQHSPGPRSGCAPRWAR